MIDLAVVALTEKQASVLAFIADFTARERWAPTRREIADHFGWQSVNAAETHIMALIRKGRLERRASAWHVARNLVVVARTQQTAPIDEAKLAKPHEICATA